MRSRTKKPAAQAAPKTDWKKAFLRGARELVEQMAERALLDQAEVQRLQRSIDEVAEANQTSALSRIAAWHRRLAAHLAEPRDLPRAGTARIVDALYESNRILAACREPAQCHERLLNHIRKLIPCEGATLYIVDRKSGRLNAVASVGPMIDLIDRIEFEQGLGFSGWVAKTQRPVIFGSLKRSQPSHAGVIKSFLSAPLVVAGETIGVLNLGDPAENVFKKEDLRVLMLVAGQAAGLVQRILSEQEIKDAAITDELTGLYNRRHLMLRLEDEVARSSRFMQEFSLIYIDVDDFKRYNEAFGPETGDRALAELGQLLGSLVRSSDILARHGGEEFVALLPSTSRQEALVLAERLKASIEAHVFPRRKRLSVSFGIASYPADAAEARELLNVADRVLAETRQDGRGSLALPSALAA